MDLFIGLVVIRASPLKGYDRVIWKKKDENCYTALDGSRGSSRRDDMRCQLVKRQNLVVTRLSSHSPLLWIPPPQTRHPIHPTIYTPPVTTLIISPALLTLKKVKLTKAPVRHLCFSIALFQQFSQQKTLDNNGCSLGYILRGWLLAGLP